MIHIRKMQMRCRRLYIVLFVFLMMALGALPVSASQKEPVVLKVPFPELEGFTMTDEQGRRSGVVVDYLNEIAKYTGWSYEYIDVDGDIMVKKFLAGEYDLMGTTYYSKGMEEYFGYPEFNCGNTKAVLLARWDDKNIPGYDIRDLNKKVIGVTQRNQENIRRLKAFLDANNLECTIREYTPEEVGRDQINQDLKNGVIDLRLGSAVDDTGEFHAVAYFEAQPHYIVTRPDDQKLLNQLNWAMDHILSSNPNFSAEVYGRYFSDTGVRNLFLNQKEQQYIQEKGMVLVAVPRYYHPLYCKDTEDGGHQGVIPDLLEHITELYGLKFSYVLTDSYSESLELVANGEVDMAGFFFGDSAQAMRNVLAQTRPYAVLNDLVVRNKSVTYPGEELTCGILAGRRLPDYIQASHVKYYDTVSSMLNAVNIGEVDVGFGLSARIEQEMQNTLYNNVIPATLTDNRMEISFAMPMPADSELLTIINKGINSLTEDDKLSIQDHNLISTGKTTMPLRQFIETNPLMSVFLVVIILLIVVVVTMVIANMRIKAANMQKEVAKSAAESKAKSEFLSRMSHEIRTPMNAIVGITALMGMQTDIPENMKDNLKKLNSSSQYLLGLINDILDMSRIDSGMLSIASEAFSLQQILDELNSMMQAQAQRRQIQLSCEADLKHLNLLGDSIRLKQVLMNLLSNAVKFTKPGGKVKLQVEERNSDETGAVYYFKVEDNGIGIQEEDLERIFQSFEQAGDGQLQSQGTGLGLPISRSIVQLMGGELKVKSQLYKGSEFYFSIFLPFGEAMETVSADTGLDLFKEARFLLAEDNPVNAEIAVDLLGLQGAEVEIAKDGIEAVERFSKSESGYYDLILMDIQMPNMGGLEATKKIREMTRPDAAVIPIIALTANSFQEDRDMAKEAGMNDFLVKPLDINHIYVVLQQWMNRKKEKEHRRCYP